MSNLGWLTIGIVSAIILFVILSYMSQQMSDYDD